MMSNLALALERQEQLVDQVRKLNITVRLLVVGIVFSLAALFVAVPTAFVALHAANDAKSALDQNVVEGKAAALGACQLRNASNAAIRQSLTISANAWEQALNALVTTPQGQQTAANLVATLRQSVPPASATDRDCSTPPDGLGPDDYPG